jgi:hypothetical protein
MQELPITRFRLFKYLGVEFDETLNWEHARINEICIEIRKV